MGTHHQNGGRNGPPPDENRPSWRPQDQTNPAGFRGRGHDHREDHRDHRGGDHDEHWRDRDYQDEDRVAGPRDPRRWEGSRGSELGYHEGRELGARSTERYGEDPRGSGAGRHDRAQDMRNRNEMIPSGTGYERGGDDRFAGHGWSQRGPDPAEHMGGSSRGRPDPRMGYQAGAPQRSPWMGEDSGFGRSLGSSSRAQGGRDDGQGHRGSQPHTHGGTGPHRGKGPVGYRRSDERIRELVCEALTDDDQIDASQIQVAVKDGEVTLSGAVDDRRIKREAEDCVASVAGVRDVHIQLRVKGEAEPHKPGAWSGSSAGQASDGTTRDNGVAQSGSAKAETENDKKHRA